MNLDQDKLMKLQSRLDSIRRAALDCEYLVKSLLGKDGLVNDGQLKGQVFIPDPDSQVRGEVIIGTFDGYQMVAEDNQTYAIPTNYSSKSKLVTGDKLKLTITPTGQFIYKQTSPIPRKRVQGFLFKNESSDYEVKVQDGTKDKSYKILLAAVTYYKGAVGDKVILLLPVTGDPRWGAVENIVKVQDVGDEDPLTMGTYAQDLKGPVVPEKEFLFDESSKTDL